MSITGGEGDMTAENIKTLDGERTRVADIVPDSLVEPQSPAKGIWSRVIASYKSLSLIMAGMYTGVGCSGTPNTQHSYTDSDKPSLDHDQRPE